MGGNILYFSDWFQCTFKTAKSATNSYACTCSPISSGLVNSNCGANPPSSIYPTMSFEPVSLSPTFITIITILILINIRGDRCDIVVDVDMFGLGKEADSAVENMVFILGGETQCVMRQANKTRTFFFTTCIVYFDDLETPHLT